jgi:phosphoglycolate phosphatase
LNPAKPLFLFDIDGTLLSKAGPHHRHALERAASLAAGRHVTTEGVPVAGMLDRDIIRLMLSQAGVSDKRIGQWMPFVVEEAQRHYPRICPDLRHRVCAGMRPFLERLRRRGIAAGLVTGNLSRIGWHKMQRAGLRNYFTFGAFAEMGRTRTELAALAMAQARKQRLATGDSRVILVGDHLNDIRAARENGITIVSVTTGPMSREELSVFSPDFLLDDIRGLPSEIIES